MPLQYTEDNSVIRNFLESHQVGILATASSEGLPHAATVYFVVNPDFSISFTTKEQTTKCRNMLENPNAALAVFDAPSQTTVQISGPTARVEDAGQQQQIIDHVTAISSKTSDGHQPPITKLDAGDFVAFTLHPKVVRMAEFVKADYQPTGELFDAVTPPDAELS